MSTFKTNKQKKKKKTKKNNIPSEEDNLTDMVCRFSKNKFKQKLKFL